MHKILIGIFAHPDDEAFGPSGTLLHEVKNGAELHLITLTAGENGRNPDSLPDLAKVRLDEWRKAGQLMGASSMHHLGFIDGELDNLSMIKASEEIEKIIKDVTATNDSSRPIEIISTDLNGITGHIDHIVASRAAHQTFFKLKDQGYPMTKLRLACIPRSQTGDKPLTDFVFMEPGRLDSEIDEIVDNREYFDEVKSIMLAHHTQREDCQTHLNSLKERVAINHFIVVE